MFYICVQANLIGKCNIMNIVTILISISGTQRQSVLSKFYATVIAAPAWMRCLGTDFQFPRVTKSGSSHLVSFISAFLNHVYWCIVFWLNVNIQDMGCQKKIADSYTDDGGSAGSTFGRFGAATFYGRP